MNAAVRHLGTTSGEPLVNSERDHLQWSYGYVSALTARSLEGLRESGVRRSRVVGRSSIAGPDPAGPASGRSSLHSCATALLLVALLLTGCASAGAASRTTKKPSTRKTTSTKPGRTTTTRRAATTTKAVAPTTTAKLSAEAKAVLAGYETYLIAVVDASRNPETAAQSLPKGVTGDALNRLLEIAAFNVAEGQYWDGTRTDIKSGPRVETIGATRATLRDCRSIGGMLRLRKDNSIVPGTTEPDVDDLLVDLVKLDGRWVVTRTDRTNQVEGRSTCTVASSP
jgi:hypothetical protein